MCPNCGMESCACMCSDDLIENREWEERMRREYPLDYVLDEYLETELAAESSKK